MSGFTTYYLGAGASAGAIPIVEQLEKHLDFAKSFYLYQYGLFDDNNGYSSPDPEAVRSFQTKNKFFSILEHVQKNISTYQSIDTYARKLALANTPEQVREDLIFSISEMKFFMSIFFLILELPEYKEFIREHLGEKMDNLDKRYTGLFASIMKNSNSVEDGVRFISWNYDLQLERTLQIFSGLTPLHGINQQFEIFPNDKTVRAPKIVKLNGSAGLFGATGNLPSFGNTWDTIKYFIDEFQNREVISFTNIYFAWDTENTIFSSALEKATEILKVTQTLIICGYSFPTYNRKIDKRLLNAFYGNGSLDFANGIREVRKIVIGGRHQGKMEMQEKIIRDLLGHTNNMTIKFEHQNIENQFPVEINNLTV